MKQHEAVRAFCEVSEEYFASGTAQSAALAKRCRENEQLLPQLEKLLSNNEALVAIASAGEIHHKRALKRLASDKKTNIPEHVDLGDSYSLLELELPLIRRMTRLSDGVLDQILGLYPKNNDMEPQYHSYVEKTFLKPAGL